MDMKHADSILIMGSNMAECHPVAFRWVMQAKTRARDPATLIHADPRFTRTSAMANIYAPLRAGSDIVFLGALIRYVLEQHAGLVAKLQSGNESEQSLTARERFFRDYLVHYTNAATLIAEDFQDTEELDGLFSGFDPGKRKYDSKKWRYQTEPSGKPSDNAPGVPGERKPESFSARVGKLVAPRPKDTPPLQHPRCVFQILRQHYRRYTPELAEQVCGTPRDTVLQG